MRGFLVSMLIWSAVAQASSACPACQARIGDPLVAPAHAQHHHHLHHGHATGAPIAACAECAAGYGCDPYGYRYCSPTDPQLFYAELYRRFYLELDRLKLNARNNKPVSPRPGY